MGRYVCVCVCVGGCIQVFIETLDYLFLSPSIKVASVIPLPSKGSVPGPFPTEPEPSDHMLIGATVDIPSM